MVLERRFQSVSGGLATSALLAGTILDPFCGSGTVGVAALKHGADFIGIEKESEYVEISHKRLAETQPDCPLFAAPVPSPILPPEAPFLPFAD